MKGPDVNFFKEETPQERDRNKQYVKWNVSGRKYVTLAPKDPDYIDAEYEKMQAEKENNGNNSLGFQENRIAAESNEGLAPVTIGESPKKQDEGETRYPTSV